LQRKDNIPLKSPPAILKICAAVKRFCYRACSDCSQTKGVQQGWIREEWGESGQQSAERVEDGIENEGEE